MANSNIKELHLVKEGLERKFEETLMKMIEDGWDLYGSPYFFNSSYDNFYGKCYHCQLMVKYK